jgi:hypothetical protein
MGPVVSAHRALVAAKYACWMIPSPTRQSLQKGEAAFRGPVPACARPRVADSSVPIAGALNLTRTRFQPRVGEFTAVQFVLSPNIHVGGPVNVLYGQTEPPPDLVLSRDRTAGYGYM